MPALKGTSGHPTKGKKRSTKGASADIALKTENQLILITLSTHQQNLEQNCFKKNSVCIVFELFEISRTFYVFGFSDLSGKEIKTNAAANSAFF